MLSVRELNYVLSQQPTACAEIRGSIAYPSLHGLANFYQISNGVLLFVRATGLPSSTVSCGPTFFGLHIHEGGSCTGTNADPFADVGPHYNPLRCAHPRHAGDLPPLIENQGEAFMLVILNSFTIQEVIGRSLIIHASPDDFTTQPTGASGERIGCGQIIQNGCTVTQSFFL